MPGAGSYLGPTNLLLTDCSSTGRQIFVVFPEPGEQGFPLLVLTGNCPGRVVLCPRCRKTKGRAFGGSLCPASVPSRPARPGRAAVLRHAPPPPQPRLASSGPAPPVGVVPGYWIRQVKQSTYNHALPGNYFNFPWMGKALAGFGRCSLSPANAKMWFPSDQPLTVHGNRSGPPVIYQILRLRRNVQDGFFCNSKVGV